MGKKLLVFVALFLIVSFPVASSSVVNFKIYGEDEIENFIRDGGDIKTFRVELDSEDTPSFDDLIIEFVQYDNNQFPFSNDDLCISRSCVQGEFNPEIQNPYICECISDVNFPPDQTIINLIYQGNSFQRYVYKDYKPPVISKAILFQKDGNLSLELDVKDEGSNLHKDKCVGLDRVLVTNNEGFNFEYDLPNDCHFEGEIKIPFNNDGTFNFQIKVVDRFWRNLGDDQKHADKKSFNDFIVDFTQPNIHNTFSFNRNGMELNYISNELLRANLSILIEDPNLENITLRDNYNNGDRNIFDLDSQQGYCNQVSNNLFNCTFYDVGIRLNEDDLVAKFDLVATDSLGNEATKEITKEFLPAFGHPAVIFLGTKGHYDRLDQSFVSNDENIFYIEIQNVVSEVSENDIKLNLANLDLYLGNNIPADKCYNENELWICEWNQSLNLNNHGHQKRIILSSKKDITGNEIYGVYEVDIKTDLYDPEVHNISSYSEFQGNIIPNYHRTGDQIIIIANVSDDSGIKKALGDFSNAYNSWDGNLEQANCEYVNSNYICEWITQPVRSGYHIAEVDLYFYDHAGNVKEREFEFIIHNPTDDEPDCYEVFIHSIQPVEYNSIRAFAQGQVFSQMVPFYLLSNCGGGAAFDIRLEDACSLGEIYFDELDCSDVAISGYNGNHKGKCYRGFFNLPLDPSNFVTAYDSGRNFIIGLDQESLCGISSYVVRQGHIYNQRENNNIAFNIPIHNNLLPPDFGIKTEINDILAKTGDWAEFINSADRVFHFAKNICDIKKVFDVIEVAYINIKMIYDAIKLAAGAMTFGAAYAMLTAKEAGTITPAALANVAAKQSIVKILMWTCASITCDNTYAVSDIDDEDLSDELQNWSTDVGNPDVFVFPGGFLPPLHRIMRNLYRWMDGEDETLFRIDGAGIPASPRELAMSSLPASILGLCLPGIVHNLNKKYQIECWRGYCYTQLIPLGMTKEQCDSDYDYQRCVWRNSWLTSFIKLVGIDRISNAISRFWTQPEALAWPALSLTTSLSCAAASEGVTKTIFCIAKAAMVAIESIITVYSTIESFFGNWDYESTQRDYCGYLRDLVEEDPAWIDMDTGRWGELYGDGIDT